MHSLPAFVRLDGRPVMLIGDGGAAEAKRRLLERTGAVIVGEEAEAALAIVAMDDPDATVARLKARGLLVNAVDRSDLCDFTLPAIVDRSPVIVAVGTGGVSAGLAAALRQRLEAVLPSDLGKLAEAVSGFRKEYPDSRARRTAIDHALNDHFGHYSRESGNSVVAITLTSPDPDDLTLRQARALAQADRLLHAPDVPPAILDRARADAVRIVSPAPPVDACDGLTVYLEMAR
ncbi:MAG: siroheme synthase [Sphingomonas sp.]|nr:MAG: siroheme synthase [Sphingomonas sp.]